MTSATEKFIRVYEDLVEEVNGRAHAKGSHSFEIEKAADRDRAVRQRRNILRYVRDVRHAVQHPKHDAPGHAVKINAEFLEEVQGILQYLQNPPNANSVGVSRKAMKTAKLSDRLGELATDMKATGFSHLPILDDGDRLLGVFNEAAVFDFLWQEPEQIIGRSMTVEAILPHCHLDAEHTETFKFVRPGTSVEELSEMLKAVETPFTRIGAIFVTPSGKAIEPVSRMITPWDVLVPSPAKP
jgi:CBS domain-containing protein